MTKSKIIEMQKRIGTTSDGFWGPKSIAACQLHLRNLRDYYSGSQAIPHPDQKSLTKAYGNAGDETHLVNIIVTGLGVKYDGKTVRTIRVNKACAASLLAIIQELSTIPEGQQALAQFAGVYENRPMRGGSLPSLHARGAAIDLIPSQNRNKQSWPASATMPLEVMEVFAKHGWLSAGAFWGRDAMHFQRTK